MILSRFIISISFLSLLFLFWYSFNINFYWFILSLIYYKLVVGLFGNQIAQHRYFSHNSFKTSNNKKYFLYFISLTTGVNPVDYALAHRHHHVESDTPNDVHSWKNKFTDIFFPLTRKSSYKGNVKISSVLDKDLRKINKKYKEIILTTIIVLLILNWKVAVFLFLSGIAWNYIHMILFRVLLVHVNLPGSYRNFETSDYSWNNKYIQILDVGEGLHNNHHAYPNKYDQAINKDEFDPAGWIVNKLLKE